MTGLTVIGTTLAASVTLLVLSGCGGHSVKCANAGGGEWGCDSLDGGKMLEEKGEDRPCVLAGKDGGVYWFNCG